MQAVGLGFAAGADASLALVHRPSPTGGGVPRDGKSVARNLCARKDYLRSANEPSLPNLESGLFLKE